MNSLWILARKLTQAQVSKIVEWTETHGRDLSDRHMRPYIDMKLFSGTYHCETITLALFPLEMCWDEIVNQEFNLHLEDPASVVRDRSKFHLRLPPKRVTSASMAALDGLQVSKRCCPACKALVLHFFDNYKADMTYPGNHIQLNSAA